MFSWFKKQKKKTKENLFHEQETIDAMEESLWEIKEEYDLPTEEILNVVQSKRENIDHMHRRILTKDK
jgi:molybdopterin converting factor small subunit